MLYHLEAIKGTMDPNAYMKRMISYSQLSTELSVFMFTPNIFQLQSFYLNHDNKLLHKINVIFKLRYMSPFTWGCWPWLFWGNRVYFVDRGMQAHDKHICQNGVSNLGHQIGYHGRKPWLTQTNMVGQEHLNVDGFEPKAYPFLTL